VPQQLADAVAQAGFEASTVTIIGQHSSGDYSVEFNNQKHAYQQSNKISPPSATGCRRSVSAMIASTSTTA
jgi:hypothetical protein